MRAPDRYSLRRAVDRFFERFPKGAGSASAAVAALATALVTTTGTLTSVEQHLSDAWFRLASIAPSGRTVLVPVDQAAAATGSGPLLPRAALADLLLKLDAAGVSRILIAMNLAGKTTEADDARLEAALARLGSNRVGVLSSAVVSGSGDNARWMRIPVDQRFARYVTMTSSDLALDRDAQLRRHGINATGLPPLVSGPAWLAGGTDQPDAPFLMDFGIDLAHVPVRDALEILHGDTGSNLAGANVIVGSYASALGYGTRVPRYGELKRAQVTALASETILLGRYLRTTPAAISAVALILLAAALGWWSARLGPVAGVGAVAGVSLSAIGLASSLQISSGLIVPCVGPIAASLIGFAGAQFIGEAMRRRATQRKKIDELQQIATVDALTGLPNRRTFEQTLAAVCATPKASFALLLCDLDGFKQINDALGHGAGDAVLREIGARMRTAVGADDFVARLGGDEFALILRAAAPAAVTETVKRLSCKIAEPILVEGRPVAVGVSIGIALGPELGRDPDLLMRHADAAMYRAKRGRLGHQFALHSAAA